MKYQKNKLLTLVRAFVIAVAMALVIVADLEARLAQRIIADNLASPKELLWGNDGHLWLLEANGRVVRIDPTNLSQTDISQNLWPDETPACYAMALHPDFDSEPFVYIAAISSGALCQGDQKRAVLLRSRYDGSQLQEAQLVIDCLQIGQLDSELGLFLDRDQKLYLSIGDDFRNSQAQNLASMAGKVLRMNLDGSAPDDNPWPEAPTPGNLIWAWGLERASELAQSPDGSIYAPESSFSHNNEVNILQSGGNYGWEAVIGKCGHDHNSQLDAAERKFCLDSNVIEPMYVWPDRVGAECIAYYNHPIVEEWQHSLLVGSAMPLDQDGSRLHVLKLSADGQRVIERLSGGSQGRFTSVVRDIALEPEGRIYTLHDDHIVELSRKTETSIIIENFHYRLRRVRFWFYTTGSFNDDNEFHLEMADAMGSFADPTILASVGNVEEGLLTGWHSCHLAPGEQRKLRIVATSPPMIGPSRTWSNPDQPFILTVAPGVWLQTRVYDSDELCPGDTAEIVLLGGHKNIRWNTGATSSSIKVSEAGVYWVEVVGGDGCTRTSADVHIGESRAQQATIRMVARNTLGVEDDGEYLNFRWFRDGKIIPEAFDSVYVVQEPGSYSVITIERNAPCEVESEVFVVTAVSVEPPTINTRSLQLYPQPAGRELVVEASVRSAQARLQVYDLLGRLRLERRLPSEDGHLRVHLPLHSWQGGMYLLRLDDADGSILRSFVVE